MPQVIVDLPFEKIVDTVKKLSEEEQEKLFFTINKDYEKALGEMRHEAWKDHKSGNSTALDNLDDE